MEIPRKEFDSCKRKKMLEMKKKMNNLTREQIKAAIEKKKVCNAKAMTVVERLIEPDVEEIWLLESLFYINQSHYQDAVEERAIMKYCGYPLCDASLDDVPKKQYHISTKQNKVFDITDRKNYCSNLCYKASIYLKDQLYTSPLWLRDCEDIVQYKVFSTINKSGSTGVEVDLGNISPVKSDDDSQCKSDVNNDNQDTKTSMLVDNVSSTNPIETLDDLQADLITLDTKTKKKKVSDATEYSSTNPVDDLQPDFIISDTKIKKQKVSGEKGIVINESIVKSNLYKHEDEEEEKNKKQKVKRKTIRNMEKTRKEKRMLGIGDKVEVFLESWLTADSLRFLYGDDKMKAIFEEFGTPTERFGQLINTKDAFLYERYTELCKRLNLIELKEKIDKMPTKPLPDYEVLKSEARELEIKVRSFFLGEKKVTFQDKLELDDEVQSNREEQNESKLNSDPLPILPVIEKHCVLATRRRIVLEKMYKIFPDIQSALGLSHFNIRHEIQEFIHTLALSATNISLSPSEWNLVSIVVIKFFTLRNELLDFSFNTELTQKRVINLLLSYKLDLDFLQKCEFKLRNIEQIIKNSQ